ncbi:phage tail terminator protein [Alkalibacillus almallahensis]|uniref:phage tail terminator protein n=1 Tax=Alkalibacillus almallahensis TaxID=1379154 RepID=UPI001423EBB5|nr:minor capsid protein [Alkalibacillus almallahensis]NIK12872.1 hypothetical protein [Alkalibacillus almallahensis]
MDFLNQVKAHMESLSFTPSIIQIGLYIEDGDSVAIRPSPNTIDDRYMDEGKIYPFSFQVLVHHQRNAEAYSMIEKLLSEYDNLSNGAVTSSDGSFNLVSIQCTNTPNFVQKTSFGVLWTCQFEAELHIKGGN